MATDTELALTGSQLGHHHGLRWQARPLTSGCSTLPSSLQFASLHNAQNISLLFLSCLSTTYLHITVAPAIPLTGLWVVTDLWMSSVWYGRRWAYLYFILFYVCLFVFMMGHAVSISLFLDAFYLCLSVLPLCPAASYMFLSYSSAHFLGVFVLSILGYFSEEQGKCCSSAHCWHMYL